MPIEAMREAVRQIALEAAQIIRDGNRSYAARISSLFVILIAASPFAAAASVAIIILAYNTRTQTYLFTQAIGEEREERRLIASHASRERNELEERMLLREEKNTAIITSTIKELTRSVDRNTEAVAGRTFIPKTTRKVEPEPKKGP